MYIRNNRTREDFLIINVGLSAVRMNKDKCFVSLVMPSRIPSACPFDQCFPYRRYTNWKHFPHSMSSETMVDRIDGATHNGKSECTFVFKPEFSVLIRPTCGVSAGRHSWTRLSWCCARVAWIKFHPVICTTKRKVALRTNVENARRQERSAEFWISKEKKICIPLSSCDICAFVPRISMFHARFIESSETDF